MATLHPAVDTLTAPIGDRSAASGPESDRLPLINTVNTDIVSACNDRLPALPSITTYNESIKLTKHVRHAIAGITDAALMQTTVIYPIHPMLTGV